MSPQGSKTRRQPANPLPLTELKAARLIYAIDHDLPNDQVQQLCQAALKIDPDSVETYYILGIRAQERQQRLDYFHRCSQAARRKPPETVRSYMPLHRLQMADVLIRDGQMADAVELLLPALAEDPDDQHEAHFTIIELMLRLGWDDELRPIVQRYQPGSPVAAFAASVLAYRTQGASAEAARLLIEADEHYPIVAGMLCDHSPLPNEEDLDDFAQAVIHISAYLLPGIRDTPGAIKWIRDTLPESIDDFQQWRESLVDEVGSDDRLFAQAFDAPTVKTTWDLIVEQLHDEQTDVVIFVFLDDSDVVFTEVVGGQLTSEALNNCLLSAISNPLSTTPARPATLRVSTKALEKQLSEVCEALDIRLTVKRPTKKLQEIAKHFRDSFKSFSNSQSDSGGQLDLSTIQQLPRCDETWLVGSFFPPLFVHSGSSPQRGCVTVVASTDGLLMHVAIESELPTSAHLMQILMQAIVSPQSGPSRLPGQLLVASHSWHDDMLECETLTLNAGDDTVSEYLEDLITNLLELQSPIKPSLRKQIGVTDSLLENFYRAAAGFYRASPWRMIGGDRLIEVYYEGWENPRRAACIMGQLGQERGLSVFDTPEDALELIASSGRSMATMNSSVIHFSEEHEVIPVDLWNIECMGWEMAGPEAAPFVARVMGGKQMMAATAEDIRILTAMLQHSLLFLDHPANQPFQVEHEGHPLHMRWLN